MAHPAEIKPTKLSTLSANKTAMSILRVLKNNLLAV
jgi:hypothetical protein